MVFIPNFELNILNGWLFFVGYLVIFGITIAGFSNEVRARLYDRSLWTRNQRILTAIGKLFTLANMILFIISPLRLNSPVFYLGLVLWALGLVGMVTALLNYSKTPLDTPVTMGIYRISRNPQIFSIWVVFIGICLMIGSALSLLLMTISFLLLHTATMAEEEACLQQYGEAYQVFMDQVPRYFVFF